jgi:hypothetical protein
MSRENHATMPDAERQGPASRGADLSAPADGTA